LDLPLARVGPEADPLSQWLHAGLVQAGWAIRWCAQHSTREPTSC
jgi:hypothetical protein